MVESGRQVGSAKVLRRRSGQAAVAVRVGVAGGVPQQQRQPGSFQVPRLLFHASSGSPRVDADVTALVLAASGGSVSVPSHDPALQTLLLFCSQPASTWGQRRLWI
jgi:hypothetical protein